MYSMVPTLGLHTHKRAGLPGAARIITNNTNLKRHNLELPKLPEEKDWPEHPGSTHSTPNQQSNRANEHHKGAEAARSSPNPRKERSKQTESQPTTGPQDHRGGGVPSPPGGGKAPARDHHPWGGGPRPLIIYTTLDATFY